MEDISQREAEDTCKSYDGHLVSINSEPEMKFILHLLTEQRGAGNVVKKIHIGMYHTHKNIIQKLQTASVA